MRPEDHDKLISYLTRPFNYRKTSELEEFYRLLVLETTEVIREINKRRGQGNVRDTH